MDLESKLKLLIKSYRIAKIIQLLYQIGFICYLYVYREEDLTFFTIISFVLLIGVLVTHYILYEWGEDLFRENGDNVNYFLMALDLSIFILAIINYPIAISAMEVKYKDEEKCYAYHSYDSQGLKINKISRYPRDLFNETDEPIYFMKNKTIKEHIENITGALVDKTINFIDDLFSSFSFKVNLSSEINNTSVNEINETKTEVSHETSSQLFEDIFNNGTKIETSNKLSSQFEDLFNNKTKIEESNKHLSKLFEDLYNNGTKREDSRESTNQLFENYYYIYVTLSLTVPSILCVIIQGFVVFTLGWIECVKYRIRKAAPHQQPAIVIPLVDLEENFN